MLVKTIYQACKLGQINVKSAHVNKKGKTMKHLIHVNYGSPTNLDKMKAIQRVVSELEIKILVNSELGNDDIMRQYDAELKELNLLYLDAMTSQDEIDAQCQAFEAFINELNEAA